MKLAAKCGVLTLASLVISLPLVFWISPTTGEGTTLLVVLVLLATHAVGGVAWRGRGSSPSKQTKKKEG